MLGRGNPLIRRIRALRRDPAIRREDGLFLAEGIHLAQEALARGAPIERVVFSDRLRRSDEGRALLTRLARESFPVDETTEATHDSLQDARSPQPVLCIVRQLEPELDETVPPAAEKPLIAVLHGIQDPGNLGSILRSADAAGAACCLVTGSGADLYHPRAVRGGMGSIFGLPSLAVETGRALSILRERGIRTIGCDPAAEIAYRSAEFGEACALFLGGEGAGLPDDLLEQLDATVRIPMRDGVNSLSVGAAAAVLLFEAAGRTRNRDG